MKLHKIIFKFAAKIYLRALPGQSAHQDRFPHRKIQNSRLPLQGYCSAFSGSPSE